MERQWRVSGEKLVTDTKPPTECRLSRGKYWCLNLGAQSTVYTVKTRCNVHAHWVYHPMNTGCITISTLGVSPYVHCVYHIP